jgi:hypothetical protein
MTPDNLRDVLAETDHWPRVADPGLTCSCGWTWAGTTFTEAKRRWRLHLARALAPTVARLITDARAEALREAADDLRQGRLGLDHNECADTLDERACIEGGEDR